jgi:hypothetical protein
VPQKASLINGNRRYLKKLITVKSSCKPQTGIAGTMDNVLVIIALFAPHPWLILVARDTRSWEKLIYW